MYTLSTDLESVYYEFPKIKKWIKTINSKILKSKIDESDIKVSYSYGFFIPKAKDDEDRALYYAEMYDKTQTMLFKDRLRFELSKVRVNITIKMGDLTLTNRLKNGKIPLDIRLIVTELTKVKMMFEGEYHGDTRVIKSIPKLDDSIVSVSIIDTDNDNDELTSDYNYTVDNILDKISKMGIESLTKEERRFLDENGSDEK